MKKILLNIEEISAYNDTNTFIRESAGVKDGEKYYTFTMLLTTVDIRSSNGLVFTKSELETMIGQPRIKKQIARGGVIGETNHPQTEGQYYYEVDLNNASYSINEFFFKEYTRKDTGQLALGLFGRCSTLANTPSGKILGGYLALGYIPACSMRGRFYKDPTSPTGRGVHLICYDIVCEPSNVDSNVDMGSVRSHVFNNTNDAKFAEAIMENIGNRNKIYNKIKTNMEGVNYVLDNNFVIPTTNNMVDMYKTKDQECRISESESVVTEGIVKNGSGAVIGSIIKDENSPKETKKKIREALDLLKRG